MLHVFIYMYMHLLDEGITVVVTVVLVGDLLVDGVRNILTSSSAIFASNGDEREEESIVSRDPSTSGHT